MITSEFKSERAIKCGLLRGSMQIVDDELEVKCACCGEFLPCDLEFYHYQVKAEKKLSSWCKACYMDRRRQRNETQRTARTI